MKKYIFLALTIIWLAFIFGNSLLIAKESSSNSSIIVNFVNQILLKLDITIDVNLLSLLIRKFAHMFEYMLLTIFFYFFIVDLIKYYKFFVVLFFASLMALTDETIQIFVEGRGSSVIDVFIDMLGSMIGIGILILINLIIVKKKNKSLLNKN